ELAHQGSTMIVVTHEMAFAREAADRVYYIDEGKFVEVGPPEQVIDNPRDERTQKFLARLNSRQRPAEVADVVGIPAPPTRRGRRGVAGRPRAPRPRRPGRAGRRGRPWPAGGAP